MRELLRMKTLTLANSEITRDQIGTRTHYCLRVASYHSHHFGGYVSHQRYIVVEEQLDSFASCCFLHKNNVRLDLIHFTADNLQVRVLLLLQLNDIHIVSLSLKIAQ